MSLNKYLSSLAACVLCSSVAMAGEITLFPLADKQSDLTGYINRAGDWVLEPQFMDAESFSTNGVAPVEKDGKWGVIDTSGNFIVPPEYESIEEFQSNSLAVVRLNRKYGMINSAGEITIDPKFSQLDPFEHREVTTAKLDGRPGFATRSGEFTPLPGVKELGRFSDQTNMALMSGEAGIGVLGADGQILLPPQYEKVQLGYGDIPFAVKIDGLWGFMSGPDNWIIEPRFEDAFAFNAAGTAPVQSDVKWGLIDQNGNWALNPELDFISPFDAKNRAMAIEDGRFGVLAPDGAWILAPQEHGFYSIGEKDNLLVQTQNGQGVMSLVGDWIIPAQWQTIEFLPASNVYVVENSDSKKAVFTAEGRQVSDFLYTYILDATDEVIKVYYGDDFIMGYLGKDYQPITFKVEDIAGLNTLLQTRADSGNPEAQLELGTLLWHGVGHRKDVAEGLTYLKMAAHQGYPPAQKALADFYFMESPSKANWALALMWDSIAKQNGAPLAGVLTTILSDSVSPEILPLIELRASQCLESGYSDCLE